MPHRAHQPTLSALPGHLLAHARAECRGRAQTKENQKPCDVTAASRPRPSNQLLSSRYDVSEPRGCCFFSSNDASLAYQTSPPKHDGAEAFRALWWTGGGFATLALGSGLPRCARNPIAKPDPSETTSFYGPYLPSKHLLAPRARQASKLSLATSHSARRARTRPSGASNKAPTYNQ